MLLGLCQRLPFQYLIGNSSKRNRYMKFNISITFNRNVITSPYRVIEYVMVHEIEYVNRFLCKRLLH